VVSSVIPGVGPALTAQVPNATRQAITAVAADASATTNRVTRWERRDAGSPWHQVGEAVDGRNGANGWSTDHHEGDLTSPIGVFTLTAAGGRLPDPGTRLPYEYRPSYYQTAGRASEGLHEGAFDYVIAIDYNRQPGYPPSDPTRPFGEAAGGDIWLHVDPVSPTHGCVAVPRDALATILGWLSPASRPVIVMGGAADLAK
jgi:L,D-peptidoglycan transpeptidase YkuD (ErfK/YbiS/YcfS/YnhG family)